MRKSSANTGRRLIACALLGAGWQAHAADGIQLYGLIDSFAASIKRSDGIRRLSAVGSGGMTTPFWGLRGSEDLGGGVKAVFQLEQFFQPDNGRAGRNPADPSGFSRSGWIGLAGRFGQLSVGRHTSQYFVSMQMVNPFVASVNFSPLVVQSYMPAFGGTVIGDTVWSNAIQYAAPEVRGLSTVLVYAPGEVAGRPGVYNAGIHLRYRRTALHAVLSAQRVRTAAVAPSSGQQAYLAGLAYDSGRAKWHAALQATENDGTRVRSRTWQLGSALPAGPAGTILAAWSRTRVDNPAIATDAHDTAALGYDHNLSRRTDLYLIYLYDHVARRTGGNSLALGMRHAF
jgi:predicted porin